MAYGVYKRQKGQTTYSRAGQTVRNRKGLLTHKDYRFETIEQAECFAKRLETIYGLETKTKEVK